MAEPTATHWHGRGARPHTADQGPPIADDRRAYRDAMKALARDIAAPATVARYLPLDQVEALSLAYKSQDGCFRLRGCDLGEIAQTMRIGGLVEMRGPYLTAYGMKVRKALRDDMDA